MMIALVLGGAGLHQYTNAAPDYPKLTFNGGLAVFFKGEPSAIDLHVQVAREYIDDPAASYISIELNALITPSEAGCVTATVDVDQLRPTYMAVNDQRRHVPDGEAPESDRVSTPVDFCKEEEEGQVATAQLKMQISTDVPLIASSGAVTAVAFPGIRLSGLHQDAEITATWQATGLDDGLKTEVVSEGYTGNYEWAIKDPLLREEPNGDPVWSAETSGIFVSIEKEKTANQALFWAGLLTGLAGAFLVWSLEMFAGRIRRSESGGDNSAAGVTAEQVAAQVVRMLDERAAVERVQAEQAERERRNREPLQPDDAGQ
ncbi:hypothetical protein [Nonomuraea rubra]|uniref:hypothetical protein n=1 Tax=Nonomuraea rubra TaxID=46180 RepID=UPI003405F93E